MTPTIVIQQLWQDGFFKKEQTLKDTALAIKMKDCTFRLSNIAAALGRASYIVKVPSGKISKYAQKSPYIANDSALILKQAGSSFVDFQRMKELLDIKSQKFDFSRLIRICEELNDNYSRNNYISTIILTRTILDHISPIFSCKNFSEIANNFKCEKSIKESFQHLENSSRKIADSYLHIQMRSKEVLPTRTQVNFTQDLDVLLGEVLRISK